MQEVAEDDEVEMPWAKPRNPLTSVQVPLSCKDFMLAFARCLCISAEDGMEEVLEKRFKTLPRISLLRRCFLFSFSLSSSFPSLPLLLSLPLLVSLPPLASLVPQSPLKFLQSKRVSSHRQTVWDGADSESFPMVQVLVKFLLCVLRLHRLPPLQGARQAPVRRRAGSGGGRSRFHDEPSDPSWNGSRGRLEQGGEASGASRGRSRQPCTISSQIPRSVSNLRLDSALPPCAVASSPKDDLRLLSDLPHDTGQAVSCALRPAPTPAPAPAFASFRPDSLSCLTLFSKFDLYGLLDLPCLSGFPAYSLWSSTSCFNRTCKTSQSWKSCLPSATISSSACTSLPSQATSIPSWFYAGRKSTSGGSNGMTDFPLRLNPAMSSELKHNELQVSSSSASREL